MVKRILQLLGIVFGGMLGSQLGNGSGGVLPVTMGAYSPLGGGYASFGYYTGLAVGALCGLIVATALGGRIQRLLMEGARRVSSCRRQICSREQPVSPAASFSQRCCIRPSPELPGSAAMIVPALLTLSLGYVGLTVGIRKKEELSEGLHTMLHRRLCRCRRRQSM